MAVALALTLSLVARAAADPPVVVVPDDPSESEAAFVAEMESGAKFEVRPLSRLATHASHPRAFVALGDDANEAVAGRWPDTPRAAVMVWSTGSPAAQSAHLVVSARPEPKCTAEALGSDGGWIVVAGSGDADAESLARALGATLVVGPPARARPAIAAALKGGIRNIWLRASRTHMIPSWLHYLAQLARLPDIRVGTDGVGLVSAGLEVPVRIDGAAVARRAKSWLKTLKRRRRPERTEEASPCQR